MSMPREQGEVAKLALSWIVVLIPLGWGVWQTIAKSLALFRIG